MSPGICAGLWHICLIKSKVEGRRHGWVLTLSAKNENS